MRSAAPQIRSAWSRMRVRAALSLWMVSLSSIAVFISVLLHLLLKLHCRVNRHLAGFSRFIFQFAVIGLSSSVQAVRGPILTQGSARSAITVWASGAVLAWSGLGCTGGLHPVERIKHRYLRWFPDNYESC